MFVFAEDCGGGGGGGGGVLFACFNLAHTAPAEDILR